MPHERLRPSRPPAAPPRRIGTRVWSAGRFLFLLVALTITFGTFFMTGMRVANRAREVTVPDLRGMSTEDAGAAVAEVGLVLRIDQRRADSTVPANHVLGQEPQTGTVLRRQRAVRVQISDGKQDPVVPAVVGQVARAAEIVLAGERIEIASRAEIASNDYPAGVIVGQDPPAAGQAARISLLVNNGATSAGYVMPDVIGAVGGRVVDVLRRRGFRVTTSDVPYPGLPAGVVVDQTPKPGFQIGENETILLDISR